MSLAQIGEFAFVLLSRASNLHLVEVGALIASLSLIEIHNFLVLIRTVSKL